MNGAGQRGLTGGSICTRHCRWVCPAAPSLRGRTRSEHIVPLYARSRQMSGHLGSAATDQIQTSPEQSVGQERLNLADELLPRGLSRNRSMVFRVQDHELGVRDRGCDAASFLEGCCSIATAMQDKGRNAYLRQ